VQAREVVFAHCLTCQNLFFAYSCIHYGHQADISTEEAQAGSHPWLLGAHRHGRRAQGARASSRPRSRPPRGITCMRHAGRSSLTAALKGRLVRCRTPLIALAWTGSGPAHSLECAVVVPKKVHSSAVKRNFLKRRCRAAFERCSDGAAEGVYIWYPTAVSLTASFEGLSQDMRHCMRSVAEKVAAR
jgi:ribonuclease P protein component